MYRCAVLALAATSLCLAAGPASAQTKRQFPAHALRGELRVVDPPNVLLNGKTARLAPGSRIRGENNLLQMSGALVGTKHTVHYTVDLYGLILDVWLLSDAERANKPWPTTAQESATWRFDAAAQRWTKP